MTTARPERQRNTVAIWMAATIVLSILLCAAVVTLHLNNQRAMREASNVVGNLRQARLDLANGFEDMRSSSLFPGTLQRDQADALLRQARRELTTVAKESPAAAAEIEAAFEAFFNAISAAFAPGAGAREVIELRAAYHALDDRAERLDAEKLSAIDDLAGRQRRRFFAVLTAAALLMGATGFLTVWSARQRQIAVASLRESEERFRLMFDRSPLPKALVDLAGNVVALNRTFTDVFGYADGEIRTLDEWRERAYPPDADRAEISARVAAHLDVARRDGFAPPVEIAIVCKDGMRREMLFSGTPLETGVLASFTDITERKRAEKALREAVARSDAARIDAESMRARLEAALGAMSESICIADAGSRFVHINEAFRRFHRFGEGQAFAPAQAEFMKRVDVLGEDGAPLPPERRPLGRALAGETASDIEHRVRRIDTGETWIGSYNTAPIRNRDGAIVGAVVTARDVTQRKADVASLLESQSQLAQAQKMEAVGQLTGGIAHDFNNLLAVIIGNLDLLRAGETQDAAEMLDTAIHAANRGAELTRRLLAFSRRQTLQPRRVDPNALVDGLVTLLKRTLGAKIAVETQLSPDVGNVIADPAQLESALLNLAVNARDAMPDGGRLTVVTRLVELEAEYARGRADVTPGLYEAISVSDTGTGMAPDIAERAFEPFFTTKGVGKGSGLGLSMVYGFAKQSGGHAAIYSEPGHGTTVTIYLPRNLPGTGAIAPAQGGLASPARGAGQKILIVDDDPDIRNLVRAQLRTLGYDVDLAADGAQALERLAAGPAPALLLTDIVMPGTPDGAGLAQAARRNHPDMPIVFMSGFADGGAAHEQIIANGDVFLQKPFTKAQIADAVVQALARGGRGA